jgi:DNA-binding transcriptional MerR regulator
MKLLNTKEVSTITGIPESTLRYWRCAGLGPAWVKLGGRVRYDEADVDAYVKANKRIPSVRAAMEGFRIGNLSA